MRDVKIGTEKGQARVVLQLATQYSPEATMREYVSNAIDARIPGKKLEIEIVLDPQDRRIMIWDLSRFD